MVPNDLYSIWYIFTEEAHDPGEPCKCDYDRQAKGESEPCGSHLILTLEQTKKQTRLDLFFQMTFIAIGIHHVF